MFLLLLVLVIVLLLLAPEEVPRTSWVRSSASPSDEQGRRRRTEIANGCSRSDGRVLSGGVDRAAKAGTDSRPT